MFEYADSARRHYRVDEPDAFGPGYEHYRARAQSISQSVDGGQDRQTATANLLRSVAVIGAPDDCLSSSSTSPAGLRSRATRNADRSIDAWLGARGSVRAVKVASVSAWAR